MTRDQYLKVCRTCTNRKLDMNVGLVCSLTGSVAAFEKECKDYSHDASVKISLDDENALSSDDLKRRLSSDLYEKIRSQQELPAASISGFGFAIVAGFLWAVVTVLSGYQIRYMAVAAGAAVGFGIRKVGKGVDQVYGIIGGFFALLACLLGDVFSIIGLVAEAEGLGYIETLFAFDYGQLGAIMAEVFSFKSLIFLAIAVAAGYKLSFQQITEKKLDELQAREGS